MRFLTWTLALSGGFAATPELGAEPSPAPRSERGADVRGDRGTQAGAGAIRRVHVGPAPWVWGPPEARLQAEPGTELVRWGEDWAGGFLGLLHGELSGRGATPTVVLPHGTITPHPGADFRIAARLDGYATVEVTAGAVDYQGDGGGAGTFPAGPARALRLGPDGALRSTSVNAPLPDRIEVEAAERLLERLRTWTTKRSFKLAAFEKRQDILPSGAAESADPRAGRRLSELRARVAVVAAWVELMSESFQVLEIGLVAPDDPLVDAIERARSASHLPL
jgi:hypothetical protein